MPAWPSNWTDHNIWTMRTPIAAIGARTSSCRNTAILCCGFWPRMWAGGLTRCLIRFCGRWRTVGAIESPRVRSAVQLCPARVIETKMRDSVSNAKGDGAATTTRFCQPGGH